MNLEKFVLFIVFLHYSDGFDNDQTRLTLVYVSPFPHNVHNPFEIRFRNERSGSSTPSKLSQMQIIIKKAAEVYSCSFLYELMDSPTDSCQSELMKIVEWKKTEDMRQIVLKVNFTEKSNGASFVINDGILKKQKLKLYEEKNVRLLISPKLTYGLIGKNIMMRYLHAGSEGKVWCSANGGSPPKPLYLRGYEMLMFNRVEISNLSYVRIKFMARLIDHQRKLKCISGGSTVDIKLLVEHKTDQLLLDPEPEYPSRYVSNNSKIICSAANGYPNPEIEWQFVSGPRNVVGLYRIDPPHVLNIYDAKLSTEWKFNCSAKGVLATTGEYRYNRNVTFVIGTPEVFKAMFSTANKVVLVIAIVAGILLVCIISLLIFCTFHNQRSTETHIINPNENNLAMHPNYSKPPAERKNYETEEVTLLAPGRITSSNHDIDGYPAPPPEIDAHGYVDGANQDYQNYHYQQQQQQLQQEAYYQQQQPEVMYAELGELPMKNGTTTTRTQIQGTSANEMGNHHHQQQQQQYYPQQPIEMQEEYPTNEPMVPEQNEYMNTSAINTLEHQISHQSSTNNSVNSGPTSGANQQSSGASNSAGNPGNSEVIYSQIVGTLPTQYNTNTSNHSSNATQPGSINI